MRRHARWCNDAALLLDELHEGPQRGRQIVAGRGGKEKNGRVACSTLPARPSAGPPRDRRAPALHRRRPPPHRRARPESSACRRRAPTAQRPQCAAAVCRPGTPRHTGCRCESADRCRRGRASRAAQRCASRGEVVRRCHHHKSLRWADWHRYHVTRQALAEADAGIEAITRDVGEAVAGDDLDLDIKRRD